MFFILLTTYNPKSGDQKKFKFDIRKLDGESLHKLNHKPKTTAITKIFTHLSSTTSMLVL